MNNKKIEQNYEQILDNEIAKAEAGDAKLRQLFEYVELTIRCETLREEYTKLLSSRDKEEASAVWSYAENKRILMELEFLEAKLAKLQNKINKLSEKKTLDEADSSKLKAYTSDFVLTKTMIANLQNSRNKSEIERVNTAIRSYVNDASNLDLPFEKIMKNITSLSKEQKKALLSYYVTAGEKFMLLTEADLTQIQTFGE